MLYTNRRKVLEVIEAQNVPSTHRLGPWPYALSTCDLRYLGAHFLAFRVSALWKHSRLGHSPYPRLIRYPSGSVFGYCTFWQGGSALAGRGTIIDQDAKSRRHFPLSNR